jgi:hypothetical protein
MSTPSWRWRRKRFCPMLVGFGIPDDRAPPTLDSSTEAAARKSIEDCLQSLAAERQLSPRTVTPCQRG